jgi:hypothetical protein
MAMQEVVQAFINDSYYLGVSGYGVSLIDATGEMAGFCIQVPKSGNIDRVGFRTGTVTTPQTLRVGIETLSSGNPSGSQYGGSAVGTQASPATNTFYEVTLGTPATAVKGDFIAVVVQFNSTIGNLEIAGANNTAPNHLYPCCMEKVGAGPTWAKVVRNPCLTIRYDDGTYGNINCFPGISVTEQSYSSASTPDERGLKFKLPVPVTVIGVYYRAAIGSAGTYDLVLYDSDGTTALATKTVTQVNLTGTFDDPIKIIFNSAVTLLANTFYRLVVKPTSGTAFLYELTVNTAAMLDGWAGGQNFHLTTRTDAGAWTDTTTKRPYIGLMVSQFQDGGGAQRSLVITGSRNY